MIPALRPTGYGRDDDVYFGIVTSFPWGATVFPWGNREPPRTLAEAAAMRLIGFDREPVPGPALAGLELSREMFALRVDNDLAQLAALRAGYGIAGCQVGVARRDPDLIRVAEQAFAVPLETWLVMHEDLRTSARLKAVYDHLAEGLSAYLATSR